MDRDAVFALVLALATASVGGYAVYDHYQQKAASQPVEGVVTYSDTWRGEETTHLDIEYRYTVDGETYNSTTVCPGAGEGCYGDPEATAETYPDGARVTVYVDRANPSRSYLVDEGPPYPQAVMAVVGGLFALLVVYSERGS